MIKLRTSASDINDSANISLASGKSFEKIDLFNRDSIKEPTPTRANPVGLINHTIKKLKGFQDLPPPEAEQDSLYLVDDV